VADTIGRYYKRTGKQGIIPHHRRKNKNETQPNNEIHGDAKCVPKNQDIPTTLLDNPVTRVSLQTTRPENGPV